MSALGELPADTSVAGYRIEGLLGRGGMGVVYRATHPDRAEPVALKLIAPDSAWDEEARERFQREARIAGAVAHRHILPVYEAGEDEGVLFVAMKCVDGADLGVRLRRDGRLSPAHAVLLLTQIASALDAAHAHGLVHRDIKPQNVLLEENEEGEHAFLADFGVTRVAFSGGPTASGDMVGTVGYASPEQIRGEAVDARSDVYALGCLLFECLTGHVPFERGDMIATLWAHLHDEPQPPSALVPELPTELDSVVLRALAKSPDARFGSTGALAKAAGDAVGAQAQPAERKRPRQAAELPSGTVTFLFTDVEGSTRLLHELGAEEYGLVLEEHRRVLRDVFAAHAGVEVDTQGDAFFAAFASASDALACARDAQARLLGGPVRVRIGVHTGEPHLTSDGYVGADVHRAARIAATGHGGQVVVSEATAVASGNKHALTPLGAHRLKGFDEPVRLFQLDDDTFPPLKTIANTNLPTPVSSFLGRERELHDADQLLQTTRLLTVTGPGGAGKTRFALELARRARDDRFSDYPDGIFVCFLSSLRDPALVLPTIAQALGVKEQPGQTAFEALSTHFESKQALLLLDNLEHLLEAARGLSDLLERLTGLSLVVTSRELLRISGETPYDLPALTVDEGILLFCERTRLEPTATIHDLCARLEGLPLAIELAAARTRLLTPEQLLDRLGQRLDLLKAGRDADPRQQTLRATIEWSHGLLTSAEQTLFARFSVFAGGCTLDAAEEVCEADLDAIEGLLDKSLLRRSDDRFWMLETIREYAAECLVASGDAESIAMRHADFFLAEAIRAAPELLGREQRRWFERHEVEHGNFRAAIAYFAGAGDAENVARLTSALWRFWYALGHLREARSWLELAVADDHVEPAVRADALDGLAEVLVATGSGDQAVSVSEESLAIRRGVGNRAALARSMVSREIAATVEGPAAFKTACEAALEVADEVGDTWARAISMSNLGWHELAHDDSLRATELSAAAATQLFEVGDQYGAANAFHNAGLAALELDDSPEAARRFHEALRLSLELGGIQIAASAVDGVARVALAVGRASDAARLLAAAEAMFESIGSRPARGIEEARHATATQTVRNQLGEPLVTRLFEEGASLSPDEAIARALAITTEVSGADPSTGRD